MPAQKEQYIVDSRGKKVAVILRIGDYRKMLRSLEEMESIQAYDKAKASGDAVIPFEQVVNDRPGQW